jgi:hypothetical protein
MNTLLSNKDKVNVQSLETGGESLTIKDGINICNPHDLSCPNKKQFLQRKRIRLSKKRKTSINSSQILHLPLKYNDNLYSFDTCNMELNIDNISADDFQLDKKMVKRHVKKLVKNNDQSTVNNMIHILQMQHSILRLLVFIQDETIKSLENANDSTNAFYAYSR